VVGGDRRRFVFELRPGEAGDRVTGDPQGAVPGAIVSEGAPRPMALPTVELDDLANIGPVAVDLEAPPVHGDPVVEAGQAKAVTSEEGREALLEAASLATRRLVLQPLQRQAHLPDASASRVALNQIRQRESVVQSAVFHLPQEGEDRLDRLGSGEIEDGPRDGGDWD
jgi:hypothetical protein